MQKLKNRRLLAMMPVRNEARRYLRVVFDHLAEYVDGIVVLDDASTDETFVFCRKYPAVTSYRRLSEPLFQKNESALRRLLWEMTVELNPEWILALDADEFFEPRAKQELPALIQGNGYNLVRFPVYHFWGGFTHYRVDKMWNPFYSRAACLARYNKSIIYYWPQRELHCGRFPREVYGQPVLLSSLRLFHLGYAAVKDREERYRRYRQLDPGGKFCPLEHYHSLADPHPRLLPWAGKKLEVRHETG